MAGASVRTADLSLEGFLAWEERQQLRFERVGGVVRAMAGGTRAHDTVANNLRALLWNGLRGGACRVHGPDLKVVTPGGDVLYPDALVRCGPADDRATTVDDPLVVVEVLSEGSARRDLTVKRQAYKTIPSLRLILYVAQDQPRIDLVRRGPDGRWDDGEPAVGTDAVLDLPELGCALPLAAIYEGIELGPPDELAREEG
ncbi:MAG: Uma2 family endonuclease [Geminicoccaceae bacterium]|nr:Uma2 family endonuclease [Geminicoccaceae bacterium]MCX8101524.1 Uma2 family endonuclease [Geminicoccaceae bacterium]MDW8370224.1 Uma2 family endonuclease [Geminicoccaceae bacterium]